MVQEFHVLRCFSCQTFQVQQVKKSKKWVCKVCGEKQSLMKEFGRGAAADCRRHVQKLNALRGRLQEVSSERLVSQWEQDDEYENEDVHEGLDQDQMDKSEEVAHVSRWSKYTDSSAEGPDEHEDEEEEQNVYTERPQFRSQGTRKRKKISTLKSFAGPNDGCEDEESRTGCSGFKRPYLHDRRFSSAWNKGFASCSRSDDVDLCSSPNLPSSHQAVCSYPTAGSSSTYTEENSRNKQQCNSSHNLPAVDITRHSESPSVSSRQKFGETKIEKDSKWNKFLTQRDEEEYDYQAHNLSHYNDNTVTPYFTEAEDLGVGCNERRYPSDEKVNSGVCVDGNVSKSHTSRPSGFENLVCEQPPQGKTPCSKLSFNSLFLTDEDFDDTF
ncbi:MRN complex-interacting protein isoform X2 [Ctenopharyngodon idella]|uniref:MRN complex-interacting protein isoform X2 n=1 Tax=Ctenopharyngodon idella TaxID=7959 RepID=UPI00223202C6|nr:MRN complex-interacting protein isoform X2 [Ctenopharyngodon idella]